jgi:SAM-dependent MidA family methyltransferase
MPREPADLTGLQQAFPYPRSTSGATTDLARLLIQDIKKNGPIPFSDYMARCLYHPDLGYYSRPQSKTISKMGDFMTSVSVGPVFGSLLARRLHRFWLANGSPSSFTLLELGSHDGSLACDILDHSETLDPAFASSLSYVISEPLIARQNVLRSRLQDRATIISSPSETNDEFGAIIANEVLDALPVPLFLCSQNQWHEVMVTAANSTLEWSSRPASPDLPSNYPDGYVTEGSPDFKSLLSPLARAFRNSLFIWVDYGLDQESLYHPARTAGTIRCYRNHRSNAHPLDHPGEQDITADVNFTAMEEAARTCGLQVHPSINQGRYLTYCARDWLLDGPSPHEISQLQTLIHPSQFGNRFHCLELTNGKVERTFP